MNDYPTTQPFSEPGIATAEHGMVVLDGPDGIAITLTAEAAMATGESLVRAAETAREQTRESGGG